MRERKEYYVYILQFSDDSFYTGVTNSIEKRMWEYRSRLHPHSYVNSKDGFKLVRVEMYEYVLDAISREKQIKRWGWKKKNALISGNWEKLPQLSKKDFSKKKKTIKAPRYVLR